MADTALVRVVAPGFVAGLVMRDGRCVEAAPILRRLCLGRTRAELRQLFARRRWSATVLIVRADRHFVTAQNA